VSRTRDEVVRSQLIATEVDWSKAVRELREVLLGLAGHIDELHARLDALERRTGGAVPPRARP